MDFLDHHQVWELSNLPPGKRTITSRWVFKAKLDPCGSVHMYKARLVAWGFTQKFGEDYDATYAPIVMHETVRVLLAIAAAKNFHIRHLEA